VERGRGQGDGGELYCNGSVRPGLSITRSLQIISPGLNKALDSSSHLKDFGTAHIAGVRLGIRF
jgi:hypothetical protein